MEIKNLLGEVIFARANSISVNLRCADLYGADLSSAGLSSANLSGANLSKANLSDANLYGANLSRAIGNMREVRSAQLSTWPVVYTNSRMAIGCQNHSIAAWWAFTDAEISDMDSNALAWWIVWKPILQAIIAAAPAIP